MTRRRRVDVNLEELDQIIDRSQRAPLSESERQKLKIAIHAMAERLLQKRSTEKTSAVLPCKLLLRQGKWHEAEQIWQTIEDKASPVHVALRSEILQQKITDLRTTPGTRATAQKELKSLWVEEVGPLIDVDAEPDVEVEDEPLGDIPILPKVQADSAVSQPNQNAAKPTETSPAPDESVTRSQVISVINELLVAAKRGEKPLYVAVLGNKLLGRFPGLKIGKNRDHVSISGFSEFVIVGKGVAATVRARDFPGMTDDLKSEEPTISDMSSGRKQSLELEKVAIFVRESVSQAERSGRILLVSQLGFRLLREFPGIAVHRAFGHHSLTAFLRTLEGVIMRGQGTETSVHVK